MSSSVGSKPPADLMGALKGTPIGKKFSEGISKAGELVDKYPLIASIAAVALGALIVYQAMSSGGFSPGIQNMMMLGAGGALAGVGLYGIGFALDKKFGNKSWFQTITKVVKVIMLMVAPIAFSGLIFLLLRHGPTSSFFYPGLVCSPVVILLLRRLSSHPVFREAPRFREGPLKPSRSPRLGQRRRANRVTSLSQSDLSQSESTGNKATNSGVKTQATSQKTTTTKKNGHVISSSAELLQNSLRVNAENEVKGVLPTQPTALPLFDLTRISGGVEKLIDGQEPKERRPDPSFDFTRISGSSEKTVDEVLNTRPPFDLELTKISGSAETTVSGRIPENPLQDESSKHVFTNQRQNFNGRLFLVTLTLVKRMNELVENLRNHQKETNRQVAEIKNEMLKKKHLRPLSPGHSLLADLDLTNSPKTEKTKRRTFLDNAKKVSQQMTQLVREIEVGNR